MCLFWSHNSDTKLLGCMQNRLCGCQIKYIDFFLIKHSAAEYKRKCFRIHEKKMKGKILNEHIKCIVSSTNTHTHEQSK